MEIRLTPKERQIIRTALENQIVVENENKVSIENFMEKRDEIIKIIIKF